MPERRTLRGRIRRYLGTHNIPNLEDRMSEITDALNRLAAQTNAASAAQATSFSNLQNAINELKNGKLDPEQAEIVARIESTLVKMGEDAQVADDGYEPAVDEPAPGEPTDEVPGTDVPAEPVTDEVPVEDAPAEGSTRHGR